MNENQSVKSKLYEWVKITCLTLYEENNPKKTVS